MLPQLSVPSEVYSRESSGCVGLTLFLTVKVLKQMVVADLYEWACVGGGSVEALSEVPSHISNDM